MDLVMTGSSPLKFTEEEFLLTLQVSCIDCVICVDYWVIFAALLLHSTKWNERWRENQQWWGCHVTVLAAATGCHGVQWFTALNICLICSAGEANGERALLGPLHYQQTFALVGWVNGSGDRR